MAAEGQVGAVAPLASAEPSGAPVDSWPPRPAGIVVLAAALTVISIYFPHQVEIVIQARQMTDVARTAQVAADYQNIGSWPFIARLVLAFAGLLLGMWGRNRSTVPAWRIAAEATVGLAATVSAGMIWILVTI